MLLSAATLLLASYVGPTSAPDANYEGIQEEKRIDKNNAEYRNPEVKAADTYSQPENAMSEPERAEEGRMVVPRAYR